jgi:hypothetical protein
LLARTFLLAPEAGLDPKQLTAWADLAGRTEADPNLKVALLGDVR